VALQHGQGSFLSPPVRQITKRLTSFCPKSSKIFTYKTIVPKQTWYDSNKQMIWQQQTDDMTATNRWYDGNKQMIWRQQTDDMTATNRWYDSNKQTIWPQQTDDMTATNRWYDRNKQTIWQQQTDDTTATNMNLPVLGALCVWSAHRVVGWLMLCCRCRQCTVIYWYMCV
jgi:hypothetical protein